ncbi:MAG: hypothetical protein V4608_03205 [Bacteroidota bacterium]
MVEHLGSRIKHLVENKFKGSKKDFAKAIGLKQETYVFEIFNKKDVSTALVRKVSEALGIPAISILSEDYAENIVMARENKPQPKDKPDESELIKHLKKTIKSQESAINAMEITIGLLQKESAPKMKYEKKSK